MSTVPVLPLSALNQRPSSRRTPTASNDAAAACQHGGLSARGTAYEGHQYATLLEHRCRTLRSCPCQSRNMASMAPRMRSGMTAYRSYLRPMRRRYVVCPWTLGSLASLSVFVQHRCLVVVANIRHVKSISDG